MIVFLPGMLQDYKMAEDLAKKHCVPCERGTAPMGLTQVRQYLHQVHGWTLRQDGKAIERQWQFKDFVRAVAFINRVAGVAEAESHHPDIMFGWGYVRISLQTHSIDGLHLNDFIVAAKINALL